jgi:hypothetical protein
MDEILDLNLHFDVDEFFDFPEAELLASEISTDRLENLDRLSIVYCKWYQFQNWKIWAREVENASIDFYRDYQQYPNIIMVSKFTYSKIYLFNHPLSTMQGDNNSLFTDFTPLEILEIKNISLQFCIDESIGKNEFLLILDTDPAWLENGMPIEEGMLYQNIMEI